MEVNEWLNLPKEELARCPCGGWLEGIGINIRKQINVYQCDKCGTQLEINREAIKGETT